MDRYYSVNKYLKELFEEKVYKIALSASHTCPNRDGKIGHKGCIFCSVSGSGEFAAKQKIASILRIFKALQIPTEI